MAPIFQYFTNNFLSFFLQCSFLLILQSKNRKWRKALEYLQNFFQKILQNFLQNFFLSHLWVFIFLCIFFFFIFLLYLRLFLLLILFIFILIYLSLRFLVSDKIFHVVFRRIFWCSNLSNFFHFLQTFLPFTEKEKKKSSENHVRTTLTERE